MNDANQETCIVSAQACLRACERCFDCCAGQEGMRACLKMCLECSDACLGCVRALARNSAHAVQWCRLCAEICEACAVECATHDAQICRDCADACRRCAEVCRAAA